MTIKTELDSIKAELTTKEIVLDVLKPVMEVVKE